MSWLLLLKKPPGSLITYAALITACGKCDQWRQVNRPNVGESCWWNWRSLCAQSYTRNEDQMPQKSSIVRGFDYQICEKNIKNIALLLMNSLFYKLQTLEGELVQKPERSIWPTKWQHISKYRICSRTISIQVESCLFHQNNLCLFFRWLFTFYHGIHHHEFHHHFLVGRFCYFSNHWTKQV